MTDKKKRTKFLIDRETKNHIKDIAFNRRVLEILGEDPDEFDEKVNEWCEEYFYYFKDMDEAGMSKYMFEETIRMIANVGGGENDG